MSKGSANHFDFPVLDLRTGLNRDLKSDYVVHRLQFPSEGPLKMSELIFLVEDSLERGYTARSMSESIFTEADSLEELRKNIREAVACHFEEGQGPGIIRLQFLREVVMMS